MRHGKDTLAYPARKQRQDNVASTSMQRHDVASTLVRRLYKRHMLAGYMPDLTAHRPRVDPVIRCLPA